MSDGAEFSTVVMKKIAHFNGGLFENPGALPLQEEEIEAVRKAWKEYVPESADYVMFWWQHCAELVRAERIRGFGLITTNSISQTFNRRILEANLEAEENPMHTCRGMADHPNRERHSSCGHANTRLHLSEPNLSV